MKKPDERPTRRKARPLLTAAAGATLMVLPGLSSCGETQPMGNLVAPVQDLSVVDLSSRFPDGNLPSPDLTATPDLSSRLPDGNLPSPFLDLAGGDLAGASPDGKPPAPDLAK